MSTREALYDEIETLRNHVKEAEADAERLREALEGLLAWSETTGNPHRQLDALQTVIGKTRAALNPERDE